VKCIPLFRDDIIAVCLSSAFHTTKAALPYMVEQKWGRIINTGASSLTECQGVL